MKLLPLGTQTFTKLRDLNCVYVDKTEHIHTLLTTGQQFFLSRPRRFGKSMTLSTIRSIYEGQESYFKDLWIHDKWDWSRRNPVLHFQFASMGFTTSGLELALENACHRIAKEHQIVLETTSYDNNFAELIEKTYEKQGKVVLLIDEYDKPIIEYLDKERRHKAHENREILRSFYSVIKDFDDKIEFLLITGVSKFSQTSIFSHLNHLTDITLNDKYNTLVGYTQTEFETCFAEWIDQAHLNFPNRSRTELLDMIKMWYNGFSWNGLESVYNPYSVLNFLNEGVFRAHWFVTGTPTFLINLMREQEAFLFNQMRASNNLMDSYDLENLDVRTILFQSGYLTVKSRNNEDGTYILDYPNREVEQATTDYILAAFLNTNANDARLPILQIKDAFLANNVEKAVNTMHSVLKDVPNHLLRGKKEDFYHAVVHLYYKYLGLLMQSEVNTSDGRMDAVVTTPTHIYIIEFKLNQSADKALQQIRDKDYASKYLTENKKIVLVGVNFSSRKRGVGGWKVEAYN
jgi:Predicted AAA-ATPase/PD-(D/E)XK nuclease superfamily